MKLFLKDKKELFEDVISFSFNPENKISWIPGQFLQYYLEIDNPDDRGSDRFFTIASAPEEETILLTTRFFQRGSKFKEELRNLNIGDSITAEGPWGNFVLNSGNIYENIFFIAGGIGITPFRSIIKSLELNNKNLPITLLYSNKNGEVVYKDYFDSNKDINVIYNTGILDENVIKSNIDGVNVSNSIFYISGPEPFVKNIKSILLDAFNIDNQLIKIDYFPGYDMD